MASTTVSGVVIVSAFLSARPWMLACNLYSAAYNGLAMDRAASASVPKGMFNLGSKFAMSSVHSFSKCFPTEKLSEQQKVLALNGLLKFEPIAYRTVPRISVVHSLALASRAEDGQGSTFRSFGVAETASCVAPS